MKKLIFLFIVLVLLSSCSNEETCKGISYSEAKELAMDCGYELKEIHFCNENTNTWWIDNTIITIVVTIATIEMKRRNSGSFQ